MCTINSLRNEYGAELPAFAWPGGYPMYYVTQDGGVLCPDCANGRNGSEASETSDDAQWKLERAEVHWEGLPMNCEHCNAVIDSAYGDPDATDD